jgi:hypothetical protein
MSFASASSSRHVDASYSPRPGSSCQGFTSVSTSLHLPWLGFVSPAWPRLQTSIQLRYDIIIKDNQSVIISYQPCFRYLRQNNNVCVFRCRYQTSCLGPASASSNLPPLCLTDQTMSSSCQINWPFLSDAIYEISHTIHKTKPTDRYVRSCETGIGYGRVGLGLESHEHISTRRVEFHRSVVVTRHSCHPSRWVIMTIVNVKIVRVLNSCEWRQDQFDNLQ